MQGIVQPRLLPGGDLAIDDVAQLFARAVASPYHLLAVGRGPAVGLVRDIAQHAIDPHVIVAAAVRPHVDEQGAHVRRAHLAEGLGRERRELRLVRPGKGVQGQQGGLAGQQFEAELLREAAIAGQIGGQGGGAGHRQFPAVVQLQDMAGRRAQHLPVQEGPAQRQQAGAKRGRVAVAAGQQVGDDGAGRHAVDARDARALQRRRRAAQQGTDVQAAIGIKRHFIGEKTPAPVEECLALRLRRGRCDGQVAIGIQGIEGGQHAPGLVGRHRRLQLFPDGGVGVVHGGGIGGKARLRVRGSDRLLDKTQVGAQLFRRQQGHGLGQRHGCAACQDQAG